MTRPNIFVRFAGSPLGALLLVVIYIAVGMRWYQGNAPWWLALGAVGAALRTWRSVTHMRAYKQWRAEWQKMGEDDTQPRAPKKPRSYRFLYLLGSAVVIVVPLTLGRLHNAQESTAAFTLWFVVCFVMFVAVGRIVLRRWKQRRYSKAEAAPVSWMLGRAWSAPSRKKAHKALPAYVVPLFNAGTQTKAGKTIDAVTT